MKFSYISCDFSSKRLMYSFLIHIHVWFVYKFNVCLKMYKLLCASNVLIFLFCFLLPVLDTPINIFVFFLLFPIIIIIIVIIIFKQTNNCKTLKSYYLNSYFGKGTCLTWIKSNLYPYRWKLIAEWSPSHIES